MSAPTAQLGSSSEPVAARMLLAAYKRITSLAVLVMLSAPQEWSYTRPQCLPRATVSFGDSHRCRQSVVLQLSKTNQIQDPLSPLIWSQPSQPAT